MSEPAPATPGVLLGRGGEFDLIRRLVGERTIPVPGVRVGPGDDCAVLEGGLAITCDLSVEGVHFRRDWMTPREIGYRAAAAALSDLAAVAARPVAALVSYGLPPDEAERLALEVHEGVEEACRLVGGAVIGGDVTASPGPMILDVVGLGRTDRPVLRNGALPGDEVWVTGRLGGAAAAVAALQEGRSVPGPLRAAFLHPVPRIAEALWLAERIDLHALIDLSDGLTGDADHLAAASGVSLVLELEAIPRAPGLPEASFALSGGEDYELCLVAGPGMMEPVAADFRRELGVELTRVGWIEEAGSERVVLEGPDGSREAPPAGGFDHFPGDRRP